MPPRRQAATPLPDDGDSQKENTPSTSPMKAEKVKQEKVKQEKQRTASRRVEALANDENDDEEEVVEDGENYEHDEEEEGSPRGHKRVRVNGEGEARAIKAEQLIKRVTLPRDTDGYIPGSIVRIQLQNFVTYDWVEFRPGPYLNMILGPNGTGKSSIACAICLGLNSPPSLLNRATELNAFVKHEAKNGHIEIELKGPKRQPNLVIRRNLSSTSKGSTFTLNGNSATGREITSKVVELNVQISNLCSFLPQDRVSEFAMMSPQQLLKETQRAAGDPNLTNWHETLISSGKELRTMREVIEAETSQLKVMRDRNETLERDVERYIARKNIEQQIKLLEILLPVQEYREALDKYQEVKAEQRRLHDIAKKLREKNKPAHDLKEHLQQRHAQLSKVREEKKNISKKKFKQLESKWKASETMDGDANNLVAELDELKQKERTRLKRIKDLEAKIQKLEHDLDNPPEMEDSQDIANGFRECKEQQADFRIRLDGVQSKQRQNTEKEARENQNIRQAEQELRRLEDVSEQKLAKLGTWNRDCADAVRWLRANRHRFKMEVFEPPILSMNVTDRRHVNAIEACFNANQLCSFVTQCPEDLRTFHQILTDNASPDGVGRKLHLNTWHRPQDRRFWIPPPMTRDEMQSLGFVGYALDFVDCPEGLKWFLQAELQMHRTAIGPPGVNLDRAMEAVTRDERVGGANFIIGSTMNQVKRSAYGRRAINNQTREIRPARNLAASNIDPAIKARLEGTITNARQELSLIEEEAEQLGKEEAAIREEHAPILAKVKTLTKRKEVLMKQMKDIEQKKSNLKSSQSQLKQDLQTPSADVQSARIKKQLRELTKKRVRVALEYETLMRSAIGDQEASTISMLQLMQVAANKAELERVCAIKDERYNKALSKFEKVDEEFKRVKADSKAKLANSRQMVDDAEPEVKRKYLDMEHARQDWTNAGGAGTPPPNVDLRNVEQLRVDLDAKILELEQMIQTNPGVIEQYEKRKQEINDLEKTLDSRERKASKIETSIKVARDNWEPALRRLVESIGKKFSASFDRIKRAGEIRISEHEDYDKWAIDILVKFRDSEKLQLLTGQRQSGGERSLTTIMYLMSLTEQARAPFSLVDEINQGMDQEAERAVHNNMVEVTCQPDSSQYFLITPKLLPDLNYHERMKVLCVNNGEWLPEERDLGNMNNMIDAYLQRHPRGRAAA